MAIGGTFQCAEDYDKLESELEAGDLQSLRVTSFVTLKSGWRARAVEVPTYCSVDTPRGQCQPRCPWLEEAASNASLLEDMWQILFFTADLCADCYDAAAKLEVLRVTCSAPVVPGDQLEASSPVDVSFWPIHGTVERLWAYKKLLGSFDDERWASPYDDRPTQYCRLGGCRGHHPADVVPFPVQVEGEDGVFAEATLTNVELFRAMDPASHRLPYVYADFAWPHCAAVGVSFPPLVIS